MVCVECGCVNHAAFWTFCRILDDCCRAAVFYAQRMTANVDEARRARKQRRKKREADDDFDSSSPKIFIGKIEWVDDRFELANELSTKLKS